MIVIATMRIVLASSNANIDCIYIGDDGGDYCGCVRYKDSGLCICKKR